MSKKCFLDLLFHKASDSNNFRLLQVAQVLLTLPYSFSQLGLLSGILLQIFYGIVGSWTAYLISVLYMEYRSRKEKENVNFKNHVIQVRCCIHLKRRCAKLNEPKLKSHVFGCSGLKFLMGYLALTGKPWGLLSTALSSSLDLSSSLLLVPGDYFYLLLYIFYFQILQISPGFRLIFTAF